MVIDNKRKHARFSCLVPVDAKPGDVYDACHSFDVSKGGIGLVSNHAMPIGHEIAVELDLEKQGEPVIALCKVQWIKPVEGTKQFRLGMCFKDVLVGSKARLTRYFTQIK